MGIFKKEYRGSKSVYNYDELLKAAIEGYENIYILGGFKDEVESILKQNNKINNNSLRTGLGIAGTAIAVSIATPIAVPAIIAELAIGGSIGAKVTTSALKKYYIYDITDKQVVIRKRD